ncbi:MAG TPA: hypothetical protein VH643_24350 [Gemmataceae bacterium]|jgi:predicted Zn finger-like uncharacterized protein
MPRIITCPDCERKLRVPDDLLGKKVRCPSCSVMFKAVAVGGGGIEEPIEEPDEEPVVHRRTDDRDERYSDSPRARKRFDDEYDRPRRRRDDDYDDEERAPSTTAQKAGWNKVRIGINLVMIGVWVWLAGAVLGGLGGLLGLVLLGGALTARSAETGLASLGFAGVLLLLSIGLYYLCTFGDLVLRMVGYGLCMAVPPKRDTGLRPLAITAFALEGAYALFWLLHTALSGFSSFATSMTSRPRVDAAGGLSVLSILCGIASFIVFMFFLRSVCNNVRARDQANKPIAVFIGFIIYWVVCVFMVAIMICAGGATLGMALQSKSGSNAAASMGAWLIIFLVVLSMLGLVYLGMKVWYVMVLRNIRDAVASYRRRL